MGGPYGSPIPCNADDTVALRRKRFLLEMRGVPREFRGPQSEIGDLRKRLFAVRKEKKSRENRALVAVQTPFGGYDCVNLFVHYFVNLLGNLGISNACTFE